jgi:hypothetical protein
MLRRILASLTFAACAALLAGCPETSFPDEGSGQPSDRSRGKAPPGSIGVCKIPFSRRPPIINESLWINIERCNKRTPRRYTRLGYSHVRRPLDDDEAKRVQYVMEELRRAQTEEDPNTRMILMTRAVKQMGKDDPKLKARIERMNARTFACDYAYLLNTTRTEFAKVQNDNCPAYAYDPKLRRDVCMFDLKKPEAAWLTSSWACLGFTDTVGEGESCHRMCAYDDYCAAQISCAQPDFDLVMCALGVCMPEEVAGLY